MCFTLPRSSNGQRGQWCQWVLTPGLKSYHVIIILCDIQSLKSLGYFFSLLETAKKEQNTNNVFVFCFLKFQTLLAFMTFCYFCKSSYFLFSFKILIKINFCDGVYNNLVQAKVYLRNKYFYFFLSLSFSLFLSSPPLPPSLFISLPC